MANLMDIKKVVFINGTELDGNVVRSIEIESPMTPKFHAGCFVPTWTASYELAPAKKQKIKVKSMQFYITPEYSIVVLEIQDKKIRFLSGVAKYHDKDERNIITGRKIALDRAVQSLNKQQREVVWDYYVKHYLRKDK